ncbi:MAG TPA: hypothetical protein PLL87_07435 [Syntrophorhabdaceae bacterium]|jgi:hypothetical protein|nr:hypothetical protein [Syntrophorhabdaceae bacterium]
MSILFANNSSQSPDETALIEFIRENNISPQTAIDHLIFSFIGE